MGSLGSLQEQKSRGRGFIPHIPIREKSQGARASAIRAGWVSRVHRVPRLLQEIQGDRGDAGTPNLLLTSF